MYTVIVHPKSSKPRVEVDRTGSCYNVFVRSVASESQANQEMIGLLAAHLGLSKSNLYIKSGLKFKKKLVYLYK